MQWWCIDVNTKCICLERNVWEKINTLLLSLMDWFKISWVSDLSHGYKSQMWVLDNKFYWFFFFSLQLHMSVPPTHYIISIYLLFSLSTPLTLLLLLLLLLLPLLVYFYFLLTIQTDESFFPRHGPILGEKETSELWHFATTQNLYQRAIA